MTIKHYEVQTNTVADGWTNTWHENDEPLTFATELSARIALGEFFDELPDDMAMNYVRADYRVHPVLFEQTITLCKGGTGEREVSADAIEIADLWHVAERLDREGMHGMAEDVRTVWHLAHDLRRHIQEG